jgi:dienelactone hydrolase
MTSRQTISYDGPGGPFEGVFCIDGSPTEPKPGVLIAPSFRGRSDFEAEKAEKLAGMGYAALALDPYGDGRQASGPEQAGAWMSALDQDRPLLLNRMQAALDALLAQPGVDSRRIAAIGFCFGGKCVLDLARSGADIRGVVSFHGVYDRPPQTPTEPIRAKVLVLHGWEDPLGKPEQTVSLARELTERGADWQIHAYGHTGHAFTNPSATARDSGMFFSESANRRSWQSMSNFLDEIFG